VPNHQAVGLLDECRGHAGERTLAGRDRICIGAEEAKPIRYAWLGGEVVHLVVEHHADAWNHQSRAEEEIDRERARDAIAFGVDHREMRRLLTGLSRGDSSLPENFESGLRRKFMRARDAGSTACASHQQSRATARRAARFVRAAPGLNTTA
jgi:hypothetical protein